MLDDGPQKMKGLMLLQLLQPLLQLQACVAGPMLQQMLSWRE